MAGKVRIEVTKGVAAGAAYEYTEPNRVYIGRQEDCGIVCPENTVSRYHCVLEVMPPQVKLYDFGSLNGTFLNDQKIGQRERTQTIEEGQNLSHEAYDLNHGDRLRLGSKCELTCMIEQPETCALCGAVLPAASVPEDGATLPEGEAAVHISKEGKRICENCWLQAEQERLNRLIEKRRAEAEAARMAEEAERKRQEEERIAREKQQKKEAEEKAKREAEQRRIEEEKKRKAEQERLAKEKAEQERKEAEKLKALLEAKKAREKKCAQCGKSFTPKSDDQTLCESCMNKREEAEVVLKALLEAMLAGKRDETPAGPSPVQGYEKVKRLGRGGMGDVWKVRETKTGKYYALKTMLPQVAADDHSKKMFLREAKMAEMLRHKNVLRTYQSGCANGVFYILMDLCEGGSADSLMAQKGGKLSLNLATWIILQVLSGLDYVHNAAVTAEVKGGLFGGVKEMNFAGVVHRDLKPGNIFLSNDGDRPIAMVADFGMAKAFQAAGMTKMTKEGSAMGTPQFMPIQQAKDFRFSKPEVDVWAAAASYYHMLTGVFPRNFKPGKNILLTLVQERPVPIRQRDPSIPPAIAAVIDKALVEVPEIGYKSAAAFRRDLVAALPASLKADMKGIL